MYQEGVMDRSHVLRLCCHVIDMFDVRRAVKDADLRGQREKRWQIITCAKTKCEMKGGGRRRRGKAETQPLN